MTVWAVVGFLRTHDAQLLMTKCSNNTVHHSHIVKLRHKGYRPNQINTLFPFSQLTLRKMATRSANGKLGCTKASIFNSCIFSIEFFSFFRIDKK